jgi:hypothetical protein
MNLAALLFLLAADISLAIASNSILVCENSGILRKIMG